MQNNHPLLVSVAGEYLGSVAEIKWRKRVARCAEKCGLLLDPPHVVEVRVVSLATTSSAASLSSPRRIDGEADFNQLGGRPVTGNRGHDESCRRYSESDHCSHGFS